MLDGIYKYVLLAIDIALIISGIIIFLNFKKYLNAHKDETVAENEKELNSYIKKLKLIGIICVALGAIALAMGIFAHPITLL